MTPLLEAGAPTDGPLQSGTPRATHCERSLRTLQYGDFRFLGDQHDNALQPTNGLAAARPRLQPWVVQPDGKTLHMTGQVAWDGDGNLVGEGDCEAQIRQSFDNVENILKAVGGRLADIVSLTIYFLDPDDLLAIQKVRAEKFSAEDAPVSTIIQTPGLVAPELLVELVPISVIPLDRYHAPNC